MSMSRLNVMLAATAGVMLLGMSQEVQGAVVNVTLKDGLAVANPTGGNLSESYAGTQDTWMQRNISYDYSVDTNLAITEAGSNGSPTGSQEPKRTLIKFDVGVLSDINSSEWELTGATLRIRQNSGYPNQGTGTWTLNVMQVVDANAAWHESTGGSPVPSGAPIYTHLSYNTVSWTGGSMLGYNQSTSTGYATTPVATISYTSGAAGNPWYEATLPVSLIQHWATTNAGLILVGAPGTSTLAGIFSSEAGATSRPELVLTYTSVPEPASLGALSLIGGAFMLRRRYARA